MKLINVNLKELKPLEQNVRRHNDIQIKELIRSYKQFGQTRAIVIDENNNILIGNGLYFALEQLGADEVQCYRIENLTDIQKKKLILSDNKTYSLGGDNYEEINNYINEIVAAGDYDIAGFDKEILEQMTESIDQIEKDIDSYGTVTDENLTENVGYSYEPEPVEEDNADIEESQDKPASTLVTEKKIDSGKAERKYVVCPSCGEVIYLD